MTRSRRLTAAVAGIALLYAGSSGLAAAQDAVAAPKQGRFSLGAGATGEFLLESSALNSITRELDSLAALSDALPDAPGTLEFNEASLDDFYGSLVGVQLTGSYGLTDSIELFARAGYLESGSATTLDGSLVETSGSFSAFQGQVTTQLDDYQEFNLQVGARYFFNEGGSLRPFVGGYGGVRFIDSVGATVEASDGETTATIFEGGFFDDTTALVAGGEIGLAFSFTPNFTFSVNAGINWTDDWDIDYTDLAPAGIGELGDTGRRISFPLGGRFTYTF